jgi:hypothetical protein
MQRSAYHSEQKVMDTLHTGKPEKQGLRPRKFVQYNLLPAIMNATVSGYGLLDDTASIGTREGWQRRLAERGFTVRGHRLVRRRGDHEADEKGEEVEPRN